MMALLKLSDKGIWMRIIWARLGMDVEAPTRLLCDAEAALRVCAGEASVARLRHALRRSALVTERVRDEEIELVHLPDAGMFMDFFTKWLPDQSKVEASLAYLNAQRHDGAGGVPQGLERAAGGTHPLDGGHG